MKPAVTTSMNLYSEGVEYAVLRSNYEFVD